MLQGEAEVSQDTQDMPGAQRSVVFHVHSWVQVRMLCYMCERCATWTAI